LQYDDTLTFGTRVDENGARKDLDGLQTYIATFSGNLTAAIVSSISSALSEIPRQVVAIGTQFESSMAQVAATMGITQTAEEFDILSEKAKEMGENTKFSASQAADALNFLALAGYNANESCAALPTVLDLAAAGGIELAQASDMVTDSMSALGLEMDELSGFADQMAVTSQKSNTSVGQLGNAILAVGANARILAGDTNELMTELGILADAGKKGAEGGTALARVIKNLSTPVSNAKKELEALGVECYDAEGNFRNMQDIFKDLKDAMSDFTEEEKQAALSEIFDTAALSSAKILLEQCGDRFDELSGYISDADGAASQMADTMSDTLAGDVTILQSALSGLAETTYEKFSGTMREAVQSVTEDVGVLNESLKDGELSESADKIAGSFSDAASSAAKLLADDAIPAVIKGFSLIIDNGNEIISVLGGIGAAMLAMKVVPVLTEFNYMMQMAAFSVGALAGEEGAASLEAAIMSGNLTMAQIAAGVFTGQISLGAAATAAFNAVLAANPLGLVAAAIGLVVAAAINLVGAMKEAQKETEEAEARMRRYSDAMDEVRKKNEEDIDSSNKQIAVIKDKVKRYEELRQRYADLNEGEMKQFLSLQDELIGLLPEGTELIGDQTTGYDNLAGSIDNVCRSMERKALLDAKYNEYQEAVEQNYDIDKQLKEAEDFFSNQSQYDPEGLSSGWTLNDYCKKQFGISYDDMQAIKSNNQGIIDEYNRMATEVTDSENAALGTDSTDGSTSSGKGSSQEQARIDTEQHEAQKRTKAAQMSEKEKNESLNKLAEEWETAEHKRRTGEIKSDEELYSEKRRIWKKYGDESRKDMWKYHEDLISDENNLAEKRKKASENDDDLTVLARGWADAEHKRRTNEIKSDEELYQVKKELWDKYGDSSREDMWSYHEDILDMEKDFAQKNEQQKFNEWEHIEKLEGLGLITSEQAYQKRKEWIEKYCPEYSDEWYSYYKTVYDYEQEFSEKQLADRKAHLNEELEAVKSNVNDILSEYKSAYSEIESNIAAYKSKLLGVAGSIFEVTETENEDGSKTKTFKVNDIKAQIETMKKYHAALLQMRDGGAPQSLLAEMMELDPDDGLQMAEYILGSGDLEDLSELYRQREDIAQKMAEEFYQPDIDALNSDTAAKITAEYESLPDEFYDIGKNAIEQLYLGMNDAVGDLSGVIESSLAEFEKSTSDSLSGMTADKNGIIGSIGAKAADIASRVYSLFSSFGAAAVSDERGQNSISAEFTRMIDAIKEIKIFNQTTSQLLLDGKITAESVNNYNDTLGRMSDI